MEYALPALAYLLGSISSAVLVARLFKMPDPRSVGSGNPGATNILRQGNPTAAALTLAADVAKGVLAVIAAAWFTQDASILALVAVAVFLGHLYPLFFQFKGGKGVATALGVYVGLNPWMGLLLIATWLATALAFRYSSLAAVATAGLSPVYAWFLLPGWPFLLMAVGMALILVWRHQANIKRLLRGEEDKIKLGRRG